MIKNRRAFIVGLKSSKLSNKEIIFLNKYKPWGVILFSRNISSIEHYNFVYFNDVTINTSCPYHNLCEKLTTTISVCTLRLTLGYLHTFSRGDSYSNIGLFQDHCSYALVPHS